MAAAKMIYVFADGKADGNADMRNELGGKGANLHEMTSLGLNVPAGLTITTDVCLHYAEKRVFPDGFDAEFDAALDRVEKSTGRKFATNDGANMPLLLSCRSGARSSMPGMMDTILNIGMNDERVAIVAAAAGGGAVGERFALDSYRRLIQMCGEVIEEIKSDEEGDDPWERELTRLRAAEKVQRDDELSVDALRQCVERFKAIYERCSRSKKPFPQDPRTQLLLAIGAVFGSWNNARAVRYREINRIPHDWGTACNVQVMVFGNFDDTSATGVAFTRDPATGERRFFGEWLVNAQGEDVVSGVRTPQPINESSRRNADAETLEARFPKCYGELDQAHKLLEAHFHDMQDMEFTIERGVLYILQTRNGKRTSRAAFRMAHEMVGEGLIDKRTAVARIDADGVAQFLADVFDTAELAAAEQAGREIARGLPAGPGAASGVVAFDSDSAAALALRGAPVILVRRETSPEDIAGMEVAKGMVTVRGGMTSHCALVARQMNKVAVVGAEAMTVDYARKLLISADGKRVVKEGEWVAVDGTRGLMFAGRVKTAPSQVLQHFYADDTQEASPDVVLFRDVMAWSDEIRRLGIRVNADTADQVRQGVAFGAEGVGLCRTEHMFFAAHKLRLVRDMILSADAQARQHALDDLLPMQRADFTALFKAVAGKPITVRLLDPPLHEFLPHSGSRQVEEIASRHRVSLTVVEARIAELKENNPMLGHRGCRLGITMPDVTAMQARALVEAALEVDGTQLEIMVPLVAFESELQSQAALVRKVAAAVFEEKGKKIDFKVGTMIETPRAALIAGKLAKHAEFFSFGSNDLTQSTLLMSRDDTASFLPQYLTQHIVPADPFRSLDADGVGVLIGMACSNGKAANKHLHVGLCGEHGGEPHSIDILHRHGLDYVSCSPSRVPVARIAAAQAAIKEEDEKKKAAEKN